MIFFISVSEMATNPAISIVVEPKISNILLNKNKDERKG